MSKDDEITMKEAAGYWRPAKDQPGHSKDGRYQAFTIEEYVDPESQAMLEAAVRAKRARETGEASAQLDAMLAASRAGKRVVK
jgi:hypothetical protein